MLTYIYVGYSFLAIQDIALVNVVYDNKVIWEAKYSFKNDKITKDERNTVYPVASVTKVITVSSKTGENFNRRAL